jgi:hypothetical protein
MEKTPRICMPTWRNFNRTVARAGLYEAEDVLVEIDNVDLLCPKPARWFTFGNQLQASLLWKNLWKGVARFNPGLIPVSLSRQYDLFVVVCQNLWDLPLVNAVKDWKKNCRVSVCWLDDVYASDISRMECILPILKDFDHVVVSLSGSVDAVNKLTGYPCHYVPQGVDVIRFSPYPDPPSRCVDVYSIGRRDERLHRALLNLSKQRRYFYIHETHDVNAGSLKPVDHREHRDLLADMTKRSRYFVVDVAKVGRDQETLGLSEAGRRYYEGAAAGSVMIGRVPEDKEAFTRLFGWPDSVIPVGSNGAELAEILTSVEATPDRLCSISRRNVAEAALRHDWSYRWKQILDIAGLKPTIAMEQRERRLKQLAEMAINDH